jgi:uncharacterized RmlC-like cupin family protein
MMDDGVRVIGQGEKYLCGQGVTYDAGVSRATANAQHVCMNILPTPPGACAKVHFHKNIKTIAYLLEGECTVFHGNELENKSQVLQGEQIFIPLNVPHAPSNFSGLGCT